MAREVRLLLFSDLHADAEAARRLVAMSRSAASPVDVLVGAGDFANARRGSAPAAATPSTARCITSPPPSRRPRWPPTFAASGAAPCTTPLYHARGPVAGLTRLGQAALADATGRVGPGRLAGLPGLVAWAKGRRDAPREPQGQSPPPKPDGRFDPGGVFRLCRHPANFWPVPPPWLNPRMTSTLAAFNAVATAYFYAGSLYSDRRLRRAYGRAYEAYLDTGVPMFLPLPRRPTPPAPAATPSPAARFQPT